MKTEKKVDPREKILKYLKEYVENGIENKKEVVLLINTNEGAEGRTDGMTELIHECDFIDNHLLKDLYQE